jgi:DNA-binding transcriptional MocR family regulator
LPERVDCVRLYRAALASGISIVPGSVFSASNRFTHHIRMSCGNPWTPSIDQAIMTLGKLCER